MILRSTISLFISALLLGTASLYAQKIGYVSTETIAKNYEAARQADERLNQMVDEWKAEIEVMRTDIEELELEMKKNRLIWSDQERAQKERELSQKKEQRDQFARRKFEPGGEHDVLAQELYEEVWEKIYLAIQKVSADDGYDIVWDKSTQPLVYVNAKYDLTVKVMKALGIDADDLERKQQDVIDADPRNKKEQEVRKRRSRRRSTSRPKPPPPPAEDEETEKPDPADMTSPRAEEVIPR